MIKELEKELKKLNPEQLQAVMSTNNRVRILASAGSGKTATLARTVFKLIYDRVGPGNILCITFTRLAGQEMKERISKMTPLGKKVTCNTFHAFCLDILRKYCNRIGFTSEFTICDQELRKEILEESAKVLRYSKNLKIVNDAISNYYEYDKRKYSADTDLLIEDFKYQLRKRNIIDLDMILYYSCNLLKEHEDIRKYYHEKYSHIMIDEYQDTNNVQKAIVDYINPHRLYIIGDDSQSIYSFRNANMELILDFDKQYPDSETIVLNRNYRSTKIIVEAANNIISHNKHQYKKSMVTDRLGEKIELIVTETEEESYKTLIANMLGLLDRYKYSDIAVLSRTNREMDNLSRVLEKFQIPYQCPRKNNSFLKDRIIKQIINKIEAALNPQNTETLLKTLNTQEEILDETQLRKIKVMCLDKDINFWEGLNSFKFRDQEKIDNFIKYNVELKKMIYETNNSAEIFKKVGADINKNINEIESFTNLLEDINEWELSQKKNSLPTNVLRYLDYLKTKDVQDKLKINKDNKVTLLTVHGSKGLEWPVVYAIGMNEGNMPSAKGDIEEETRLAYVEITRAKDLLKICRYTKKLGYNNMEMEAKESRFIDEMSL